ncbi:MAG: CapA family protein [Bacillota bacterium]|nr:CapA family protein [Bacillota bacterium]
MKILSRILSFLLAFLLMALPCLAENPPMAGRRPLAPKADPLYAKAIRLRPRYKTLYLAEEPNSVKFPLTVDTIPERQLLAEGGNPVIWESENEAVATVDENGVITAVGMGTTRIRASVQARTRVLRVFCRVRVRAVPVRSISINPNHLNLDLSNELSSSSAQLTAKVLPENASCKKVIWESSNDSIATVENGLVKAKGKGFCTITATDVMTRKKTASTNVCCFKRNEMIEVVFTAGGDLVLGGDKKKKTDLHFANCIKGEDGQPDYRYVLENLFPLLDKDDFSIFNLECPLLGRGSPRKPSRKFNFCGKPEYAMILKAGSVEVANIVNNHAHDYGTKPQTVNILKDAGIIISDEQIKSDANVLTTKDGVRVGFIGFFGPVSSNTITSRIKTAKDRSKCDMLVASFHFCDAVEHSHAVRSSQIRQARAAVNAGAAVVLGHHTHVPSAIEVYNGVYIYYGLGSTQSSGKNFGRRNIYNTFLTQQTILFDPVTKYTLCEVPTIYPICPTSAPVTEENNCQPISLKPGDDRFKYVLDVLDIYARRARLNPAPFHIGTIG